MGGTVKVTVSMPIEDVERLKALHATGVIESASGYVAQAVHDRLDRQAWLDRWQSRVGEPDPEVVALSEAWQQIRNADSGDGEQMRDLLASPMVLVIPWTRRGSRVPGRWS